MMIHFHKTGRTARSDAGQATVFVVLAIGTFLLGAVAFGVDMANLWFHRQAAQNAADAACTAGALDLLYSAEGQSTGLAGFTPGTAFDCSSTAGAAPCKYASFNGYDGKNTSPGNQVSVSFPATVPGTTPPPGSVAPVPFIRVDVVDHVKTYFSGLLSGKKTQDVRAFAECGLALARAPIPIIVLDPINLSGSKKGSALSVQGTPDIRIYGGPTKSIQVNSSQVPAVDIGGSATVDLTQGGPSLTGSSLGTHGGPTTAPGGFKTGPTGSWQNAGIIPDPFATYCEPGQSGCDAVNGYPTPSVPGAPQVPSDLAAAPYNCKSIPCSVPGPKSVGSLSAHGCPDPNGCLVYTAGDYSSTLQVKNNTAVFDPGLYYLEKGLTLAANSTVRPGTGTGDGSGGTTFYFSGTSTVSVAANSGSNTNLTAFSTSTLKCTSGSQVPPNLPATLGGNILIAPCTGYYGDPLGSSDPIGEQRGFLFFQDRSAKSVNPNWGGGGQFLLAGNMYFHSCNSGGTGAGCGATPTWYNDSFTLQGNSGSGTYVLGNIVTDNLILGGTSAITMDLNPTPSYNLLFASLLR